MSEKKKSKKQVETGAQIPDDEDIRLPVRFADLDSVREWASYLSAETRKGPRMGDWYVMPDEVSTLLRRLMREQGGLHALIGYQGVGKTSALLAIHRELRKPQPIQQVQNLDPPKPLHFIKWDKPERLVPRILRQEDELGKRLRQSYGSILEETVRMKGDLNLIIPSELERSKGTQEVTTLKKLLQSFNVAEVERRLGKSVVERLRYEAFIRTIGEAEVILIDLPDYSRTDMRRVSSDLEGIYWLWNDFSRLTGPTFNDLPNIVISFQKEMFRNHYFLGKMNGIELKPLKPQMLVEAYRKRFPNSMIFTEDALLLLAKMSRGVFRRFLRYITLALDLQEHTGASLPITADQVREAIPPHLLAEDMDQQLTEIFPRQPDMRTEAVKLLVHLQEHGPTSQTKIKELLHLPDYTVSRLLSKLEDYRYIRLEKKGIENIISPENP